MNEGTELGFKSHAIFIIVFCKTVYKSTVKHTYTLNILYGVIMTHPTLKAIDSIYREYQLTAAILLERIFSLFQTHSWNMNPKISDSTMVELI